MPKKNPFAKYMKKKAGKAGNAKAPAKPNPFAKKFAKKKAGAKKK